MIVCPMAMFIFKLWIVSKKYYILHWRYLNKRTIRLLFKMGLSSNLRNNQVTLCSFVANLLHNQCYGNSMLYTVIVAVSKTAAMAGHKR